jgi:uncharacterized membrane protein (DUF485 family)
LLFWPPMKEVPSSSPPAAPSSADLSAIRTYNARLGLVLFAVYLACYVGFVVMAAVSQDILRRPAWGGVNVAVLYGFGLILGAFVISIVYMLLCRNPPANP